ncbi:uncharacterized protein LOC124256478 [Haliotis rubra]|uniref:uncharacterized protein LOC124256478 n=1 Tax=Haliotis rubra TaxID=36100 RepID=UPI001EE5B371|nr:uncharacterized protein LOC124256478 [Haliotis rubra]
MQAPNDHCETCSELLKCIEDFDLPEDNVLLIDVDVKVINTPLGKFNKKERQDERKSFVNKLKKNISALRNTAGGVVLVHLQGLTSEDKCLDYFHEIVDVKLNDMIEDGSLFVQSYQKDWLQGNKTNNDNNSRFQGFVAIHVTGSRIVTTLDFNSGEQLETPHNTIQVAFHPVTADRFVLEVAVAAVDGLLFYDKEGPEAYEYENSRLKRLLITDWYERIFRRLLKQLRLARTCSSYDWLFLSDTA